MSFLNSKSKFDVTRVNLILISTTIVSRIERQIIVVIESTLMIPFCLLFN